MKKKLKDFYYQKIAYPIEKRLDKILVTRHCIPLSKILSIFLHKMLKEYPEEKASAMAFNFILSIFPGIIFFFTLLPYIPVPNLRNNILNLMKQALPETIYEPSAATIIDIIEIQRGGLLSFGFLMAIFFATNGIRTMMITFNMSYETVENRSMLKRIYVSVFIAILLLLSIITIVSISIFINVYLFRIEDALHVDQAIFQFIIEVIKYILFLFLFIIIIAITYYLAPAAKTELKFFSPGVFIAAFLCLMFTLIFTYYVNNFNAYNRVYGSIGALMGIMIWFLAICLMILIGFELNSSIEIARTKHGNKNS